jgi:hypothetical protein
MAGGGKGGKQTSEVTIPQYIEDAARRNLNKADDIAAMGYVPEYGPTVAAFTPMQEAAFRNTADAASAFGLSGGDMSARDLRGGMDAPTTYAGGVRGYSSAPMYEDMLAQLEATAPGQYDYLRSFSIDPVTGAMGSRAARAPAPVSRGTNLGGINMGGEASTYDGYGTPGNGRGLFDSYQGPNLNGSAGYGPGGYTGVGDMIDRGGAGQRGGEFSGGGFLSTLGNAFGGRS